MNTRATVSPGFWRIQIRFALLVVTIWALPDVRADFSIPLVMTNPSGDPSRGGAMDSSFTASELRDANASTLLRWFNSFGRTFPLNIEVIENESRSGLVLGAPQFPPRWEGLIASERKMSLREIVLCSRMNLGAAIHEDRSGMNLEFHPDRGVPNPFDTKLRERIEGTYTFSQAFSRLRDASRVDLDPYSANSFSELGSEGKYFVAPAGASVRGALNILGNCWNIHWTATVIGKLQSFANPESRTPTEDTVIMVWFRWPAPKR